LAEIGGELVEDMAAGGTGSGKKKTEMWPGLAETMAVPGGAG